jgi:hypothetical protein
MDTFSERKFAWVLGVVKRLRAEGMKDRDIARRIGITHGALVNMLRRRTASDSVVEAFCRAFDPAGPVLVPDGMVAVDAKEYASMVRVRDALGVLVKELGNDSVI